MVRYFAAFIVCYSVDRANSLNEALEEYRKVKCHSSCKNYVLVGLKADLREQIPKEGDPEYLDSYLIPEKAEKIAIENGFEPPLECSALENKGVNKVFLKVYTKILM